MEGVCDWHSTSDEHILMREEKYRERTLLSFWMEAALPGEFETAALQTYNQVVPKNKFLYNEQKKSQLFGK